MDSDGCLPSLLALYVHPQHHQASELRTDVSSVRLGPCAGMTAVLGEAVERGL